MVNQGAALYRIEQAPFQAAVQKAEGALYRTQAIYANAALDAERAQYLADKGVTALAVRDQRVADAKSAKGNMLTAEGTLTNARIDLGYTEITAPITGLIDRTSLTKGNLVGPASGVLTTLVSQDPIYVVFPVSERLLLRMKRAQLEKRGEAMHAVIRFSDGTSYDKPARLDFLGVSVDESTDTVTVRGNTASDDRRRDWPRCNRRGRPLRWRTSDSRRRAAAPPRRGSLAPSSHPATAELTR